jgi:hypothetical protein
VQSRECLLQNVIIFQVTVFQKGEKCDENFGRTTSVILSGSDEAVSKAKRLKEDFLNNSVSESIENPGNHSCFQRTEPAVSEPELTKREVINWVEVNRKYVSGI